MTWRRISRGVSRFTANRGTIRRRCSSVFPGGTPCARIVSTRAPANADARSPFGFLWLLFKLCLVYVLRIRTTVDATPLHRAGEIRGSHGRPCPRVPCLGRAGGAHKATGRPPDDPQYLPVLIARGLPVEGGPVPAEDVYGFIAAQCGLGEVHTQ